jgi:hypothetical protein
MFPPEIYLNIFEHLGFKDLFVCMRVCKNWKNLVKYHLKKSQILEKLRSSLLIAFHIMKQQTGIYFPDVSSFPVPELYLFMQHVPTPIDEYREQKSRERMCKMAIRLVKVVCNKYLLNKQSP